MLRELTSMQIAEWMAYYRLEPWGFREDWRRIASLASLMANVWRGKGSKSYKPEDFMPSEPKLPRRQTLAEQRHALSGLIEWARRTGRLVEKKKGGSA